MLRLFFEDVVAGFSIAAIPSVAVDMLAFIGEGLPVRRRAIEG